MVLICARGASCRIRLWVIIDSFFQALIILPIRTPICGSQIRHLRNIRQCIHQHVQLPDRNAVSCRSGFRASRRYANASLAGPDFRIFVRSEEYMIAIRHPAACWNGHRRFNRAADGKLHHGYRRSLLVPAQPSERSQIVKEISPCVSQEAHLPCIVRILHRLIYLHRAGVHNQPIGIRWCQRRLPARNLLIPFPIVVKHLLQDFIDRGIVDEADAWEIISKHLYPSLALMK